MTVKNCWLLCKELAQTNSNQSNYSCFVLFDLCVCVCVWRPSQKLSYVGTGQPKIEDTMQAWTRNSSVSSQALYHQATAPPLLFEENAMQFYYPSYAIRDC